MQAQGYSNDNDPGLSGRIKFPRPTAAQRAWLRCGLDQPGGKLPLFNELGQHYPTRTIRACIIKGWAEPWFSNPTKPDWLVCKLTSSGRRIVARRESPAAPSKTVVAFKNPVSKGL